ncbi:MAG: fibronectin type III domain-containing protein [bacterium]|nr:fibronectin type III domain-containing protein [bacterium]
MFNKTKNLIIFFALVIATFAAVHFALAAVDVWGGQQAAIGTALGLGDTEDPRVLAANIIRIALGFLGIIAVIIVIYGGWTWMTAGGDAAKIDKAKKILINAAIGLVLILVSFGIATFVMQKLLEATGGGAGGGCDPPCAVGECCISEVCQPCPEIEPGVNTFFINSTVPTDGSANVIRNIKIKFTFNTSVDSGTVSPGIAGTFQVTDGAAAEIPGSAAVESSRIIFTPDAACPVNPCGAVNCLPENENITVTAVNGAGGILSVGGLELSCTGFGPCAITFATGDQIDCQDPEAGLIFNQVCAAPNNEIYGWATDDSGIDNIEFFISGASINDPGNNPAVNLDSDSPFNTFDEGLPVVFDGSGYTPGEPITLRADAEDLAGNSASKSQTTTMRPAHCCNSELDGAGDPDLIDPAKPELGVDCGGECAACVGAACGADLASDCVALGIDCYNNNDKCASAFCDCSGDASTCADAGYGAGVNNCCLCQIKPVIYWLAPVGGFCDGDINTACQSDGDCAAFSPNTCNTDTANGAIGNLATVGGKNFGDNPGAIYFSDGAGGWIQADLANSVNPQCDSVWQDNQIIAVVPVGAGNGPIKVVTAINNYEDLTDDDYGPAIDDFIVNTIIRPGLCKMDPDNGVMDDSIDYYGIKLAGASAYFGKTTQYAAALNSNFVVDLQGAAQAPNIQTGKTTSFVIKNNINSNYLIFTKNEEPVTGPYITSFEPIKGKVGQYVTVYGSGFGAAKGTNRVYFGGAEADYNFPDVCADSFWSNNQVIVKVPAGAADGAISMEIGSWTIDTGNLSPNAFDIDSSLPLAPSLCKLSLLTGANNSPITLWGEYFGPQATGLARFHFNRDQSGAAITFWGPDGNADKAETTVHQDAISGPVRAVQAGLVGNSINFNVGVCAEDASCGVGNVCCPAGSYKEGECVLEGMEKYENCYVTIFSSVYEWDFSTSAKVPCDSNAATLECEPDDSLCKNLGFDFCDAGAGCVCANKPDVESCMGYGNGQCDDNLCPNSPGQCSYYTGGNPAAIGICDPSCNNILVCNGGVCSYNNGLDRCILTGAGCSLPKIAQDVLGKDAPAYCADYSGVGRWHINTKLSCPAGWTNIGGGKCIEDGTTCDICANGFICLDDYDGDDEGVCAVNQDICPAGAVCNAAGECVKSDAAVCECCCRIANASQDCCAPLDCAGNCGSDAVGPDTDTYGYCTGCANAGATQAEHDAACNCSSSSGKYCDTGDSKYPSGVCRDCAQLSTAPQCFLHPTTCCIDAMAGNNCRGGDGNLLFGGFCAYYDCQIPPNEDQCDGLNLVASGAYRDIPACQAGCAESGGIIGGLSCYNSGSGVCDLVCGAGYTCLGDTGCVDNLGPPTGCVAGDDSCLCCCDPTNDQCALINENLSCIADKEPCESAARGLCCGCTADSECGDPANIGCGLDSCCHSRLAVDSNYPADEAVDICRNTIITVGFDQKMDINSFSGNIVAVGDYGSEQCPKNTQFLTKDINLNTSIFARVYYKILTVLGKFLEPAARLARAYDLVESDHNYCAISGRVSGYNDAEGEGALVFNPSQLLDADRTYYVIIKGDADINDAVGNGVLSYYKIGMNGPSAETFNARAYGNSYIWSFKTGSQVCQLSYITIDPVSHLFQTAGAEHDFQAYPKAANGQNLANIPGVYNWKWDWSSDNTLVAQVTNSDNPLQTVTSQNIKDGKTYVKATATITEDNIIIPNTIGQSKTGKAAVYVFLCENPWPPVPISGIWQPWIDNNANCSIIDGGCFDTSYEIYYCRDADAAGTADDLPPVLSGVGESVIRGKSDEKNILKEFYFFRENAPAGAVNLTAVDDGTGGSVTVSWPAAADLAVTGYKLYWGGASGDYDNYKDVGNILSYTLTGLTNNETYYFNLTSYYNTTAESDYYGEVEVAPSDITPPAAPANFSAVAGNGQVDLRWDANTDDTVSYKVYYGTSSGVYGASENVGNVTGAVITDLTNGTDYYFAVTALDAYNNESGYSAEATAAPVE